eukprot:13139797-Alexandrium_andersonii.AAC.1
MSCSANWTQGFGFEPEGGPRCAPSRSGTARCRMQEITSQLFSALFQVSRPHAQHWNFAARIRPVACCQGASGGAGMAAGGNAKTGE